MKKKIREIWHYRLYVNSRIFESLGVMMLLYELMLTITPIKDFISTHNLIVFFVIVLISVVYSIYGLLWPKRKLTLNINKRTQFVIEQGDLMKSDGIRVIPVNEYFDTHLGDGIVNRCSLHGQLLFSNSRKIHRLRQMIDDQLAYQTPLPSNRNRNMVSGLPNKRYPLGTCIRIYTNDICYILVAITHFDKYEHVDVTTEEFPDIIRKMFIGIEQLHDGKPVYMPLVGSGISGYELTNMQILYIIVQAAQMAKKLNITKGLHLYVNNEEQMKSINLNVIKYMFNRWTKLE